jgi:ECF transporter S component (folate family)
MNIRILTFSALLIALTVVFQRIGSITVTPWLRFSLAPVTIMLSGLYGGPLVGGMVGGVSDFVGMLISGQGAFHPGIWLHSSPVSVNSCFVPSCCNHFGSAK